MKFGKFDVSAHNFGNFRLDGGAMFGPVPKNLWAKMIVPDELNRIPLATRALIVRDRSRVFLLDLGCGDKWSEKLRKIYAIETNSLSQSGIDPDSITDIILTHLHFDHCGGISKANQAGELIPAYPKAQVILQRANYQNGCNPNLRERASYLKENVQILAQVKLLLTDDSQEIYPDLWVHRCDGHTKGLQIIELRDGARSLFYLSDLAPTSHHLPLPYTMGYDMCAETAINEKTLWLEKAAKNDSIVVFEHDVTVAAATIEIDSRGHYAVKEQLSLA